jgi:tRNA(Ser,Leu) C12 N-acetylase TAN1
MAEIQATITSPEMMQEKMKAALGFDQPSALDVVRREDYKSDVEYIHALAETQAMMDAPEYQKAARKVAAEKQRRQEQETREAQHKEYNDILNGVTLQEHEKKEIDTKAAEMARSDLGAGKIFASDLGRRIEKYAAELTEKKKRELAANIQMNRLFRGK